MEADSDAGLGLRYRNFRAWPRFLGKGLLARIS